MEIFRTILTDLGIAAEAEATSSGIPIVLTEMALGDSNGAYYEPDPEQTELVNEVWRGSLYSLRHDPDNPAQFIAEVVIPPEAPSFFVREAGLFTDGGVLYAVAKHPLIEKVEKVSGINFMLHIQFIFRVSNVDSVEIIVDPAEDITIDDALVPSGDTGTPALLFCWLAHMIMAITGKENWRTDPATTIEALETLIETLSPLTIDDTLVPDDDTEAPATIASWLAHMIMAITGKENWRTAPATTLEALSTPLIPAGSKLWFYQDTAPTGWTIEAGHEDKLLGIKGGEDAYNVLGGNDAGTWTQPDHGHDGGTLAADAHAHTVPIGVLEETEGVFVFGSNNTESLGTDVFSAAMNSYFEVAPADEYHKMLTDESSPSVSGGTGASSTSNTWRPVAALGIICVKD